MKHKIKLLVEVEMSQEYYDEWVKQYGSVNDAAEKALDMMVGTEENCDDYKVGGTITIDGVDYER